MAISTNAYLAGLETLDNGNDLGSRFRDPFGYATASSGSVTQATSITTGVTLNKVSGQVTTVSSTLITNASANFTVTNSFIAATDVVEIVVKSYGGAAGGVPVAFVTSVAAGSFGVSILNIGATTLNAVVVLSFVVIKS